MLTRRLLNLRKPLAYLIPSCSNATTTTSAHTVKVLSEKELKVTDKARQRLKEVLDSGDRLRLEVDGGGCSGFEYKIRLDQSTAADDLFWTDPQSDAQVVVDEMSLVYLKGATLDYVEDLMKASFRIVDNPVAAQGCSCGSSFAPKLD